MSGPATEHILLDGRLLRAAWAAAAQHLRDSARAVDAINVYPVPDGDTGSNMSATLREAVERTRSLPEGATVGEVLATLARGALYGARGNSGVILSQALRGFAAGVGEAERLDARKLASGLEGAATQAYRAVSAPQEGTMLTVLRRAAAAAAEAVAELPDGGEGHGCVDVLRAALAEAEVAEANTMEQLAALKEAGVPDAGGEGVCVILRGLLGALIGSMPEVRVLEMDRPLTSADDHGEERFGYCTEFLLEASGRPLDLANVRALAESGGNRSVVVVGDAEMLHVHVHALEPQQLIDAAAAMGAVSRVKVEDMTAQHVRFRASGSGAGAKIGVLALSRGAGFDAVFESLGAAVADLGLLEKPPAGEIADAADALQIPDVIVLPNHKNVLLAAEQARELTRCTLHVVPTASLPQGIAAALAFDGDDPVQEAVASMIEAINNVRTVEVTIAGATRTAEGVAVQQGEAIALVDGKLVASKPAPLDALLAGLNHEPIVRGALITLYGGEELAEGELEAARAAIEEAHPGVEVEVVEGQQPLYRFIASVE